VAYGKLQHHILHCDSTFAMEKRAVVFRARTRLGDKRDIPVHITHTRTHAHWPLAV
jgi:hypothetical protein